MTGLLNAVELLGHISLVLFATFVLIAIVMVLASRIGEHRRSRDLPSPERSSRQSA